MLLNQPCRIICFASEVSATAAPCSLIHSNEFVLIVLSSVLTNSISVEGVMEKEREGDDRERYGEKGSGRDTKTVRCRKEIPGDLLCVYECVRLYE